MSRDPWYWQRAVLDVRVGSALRKLILTAIARRVEVDSGRGFVAQADLAHEAECDVRTVRRHLVALEQQKLIARYPRFREPDGGRLADGFVLLVYPPGETSVARGTPGQVMAPSPPDSQVSDELPEELPGTSSPDGEDAARAKAEPLGFGDWLDHHASVTGHSVPTAGTQRRARLAAAFGSITADGFNPDDFIAATRAVTTEWHRERGHDSFETVLRKTEFGAKVARGRAEALKDAERAPMREKYDGMDGVAPVDPGVFD